MKSVFKLIVFIIILGVFGHSYGQFGSPVEVETLISPPYNNKWEEFTDSPDNLVVRVTNRNFTNLGDTRLAMRFYATLTGVDNGIVITTDINAQPDQPFFLEEGETRVLTGIDINELYLTFDENSINAAGLSTKAREQMIFSRILPEGNYILCIQALAINSNDFLSEANGVNCADFEIRQTERPFITSPMHDDIVLANDIQNINFAWSQAIDGSPDLLGRLEYDLRVAELEGQLDRDPTELILDPNTTLVIDERDIQENFFFSTDGFFERGQRYVMMVTAKDALGEVPFKFNGQSEVVIFQYGEHLVTAPELTLSLNAGNMSPETRFSWTLPKSEKTLDYTKLQSQLFFIDVDEHNSGRDFENLASFLSKANQDEEAMSLVISDGFTKWHPDFGNRNNTQTTSSKPVLLESGHRYAMVVQGEFTDETDILNDGYSKIMHFTYGEKREIAAPVITYPDNDIAEEIKLFQWRFGLSEEVLELGELKTTLSFIDLEENNNEEFENLDGFLRKSGQNGVDKGIGLEGAKFSWDVGNFNPNQVALNSDASRRPEFITGHKYAMLVKCKLPSSSNVSIANGGYSQIIHFTYGEQIIANAPKITNPSEDGRATFSSGEEFAWLPANNPGQVDLKKLMTTISFVDVTNDNNGDDFESLEGFLKKSGNKAMDVDMGVGIKGNYGRWLYGDTGDNTKDSPIKISENRPVVLQNGHRYAMVVYNEFDMDPEVKIENDGYSNMVHFTFNDSNEIINDELLSAVFPTAGDTLPYVNMQLLMEIEKGRLPITERRDYSKMDFTIKVTGKDDYNYERTDDNKWGVSGLREYMSEINDKESISYYQFWMNKMNKGISSNPNKPFTRGENYNWTVDAILHYGSRDLPKNLSGNLSSNFTVGMTRPHSDGKLIEQVSLNEEKTFAFKTGTVPKPLLPEYDIIRVRGKGDWTWGLQENISERYVLQFGTDEAFDNPNDILFTKTELLSYELAAGQTNDNVAELIKAIYHEVEFKHKFIAEDTYYWRVVYLNEELIENIPTVAKQKSLEVSDYYISSPVYTITMDEKETEEEVADQDKCKEEFDLKGNTKPVATLENLKQFTAGHFTIEKLKDVQKNGENYSGQGAVKFPLLGDLYVGVTFSNIKLNDKAQLVEGKITALKDSSFTGDISTLGEASKESETVATDGRTTSWLRQNTASPLPAFAEETTFGLPLEFSPEIDGQKFHFGILGLELNSTIAKVKMIHEFELGEFAGDNQNWFGSIFTVALTKNGFGLKNTKIGPSSNVTLGGGGGTEWALVIKAEETVTEGAESKTIEGTHIEFDCDGLKGFAVNLEIHFPTDILVKDMDDGSQGALTDPVKGYAGFSFKRGDGDQDKETNEEIKIDDNNFMLRFSMDRFQIRGMDDWAFTLNKGYIDLSSLENPENFKFPSNYDHAAALATDAGLKNTWQGFWLKELALKAPRDFYKESGNRPLKLGIKNLLIDKTGFSGNITAENIISIADGEIEGFAFSLDSVNISIIQNTFRNGSLAGDFRVPVSKGEVKYNAIVAYTLPDVKNKNLEDAEEKAKWGFFMNIQNTDDIVIPVLMGNATLKEDSYVRLKLGEVPNDPESRIDEIKIEEGISVFLNGNINISSGETGAGDDEIFKDIEAAVSFEGVDFNLKYGKKTGFEGSKIAFASPQKFLGASNDASNAKGNTGGFPVGIGKVDFKSTFDLGQATTGNFCTGVEVSVPLYINLMKNGANTSEGSSGGFKAETTLLLKAKFFDDSADSDFDRIFKLEDVSVGCIKVGLGTAGSSESGGESAEQNGVTFDGELCFINNDAEYGSGVAGKLHVGLPVAEVDLAAMFAVAPEGYRYWFVDGKVLFEEGITMGSLQLLGLGGGIYWNMKLENLAGDTSKTTQSGKTVEGYNTQLVAAAGEMQKDAANGKKEVDGTKAPSIFKGISALSGFAPTPQNGSKIFKLLIPIASAGDASTFNMDVGVSVKVEDGKGLTQFDIVGDGYVMADPKKDARKNAPVKVDVHVGYQTNDTFNQFDAHIGIYVDFPNAETSADVPYYIKGRSIETAFDGKSRSAFILANFHIYDVKNSDNDDVAYFKMGSPKKPGGLMAGIGKQDNELLKIEIQNYLQIGNKLDTGMMKLPPLMEKIFKEVGLGSDDGKSGVSGDYLNEGQVKNWSRAGKSDNLAGNSSLNEGFIMGLSAQTSLSLRYFILKAQLEFAMGFDLNVLNYGTSSTCYLSDGSQVSPIGSDGWYATGQVYAGIKGTLSINVELFLATLNVELFELGAAFQIRGGFPNPVWAEGRAGIYYEVLGGALSGSANMSFSIGNKCVPPRTDPFGFPIIEAMSPQDGLKDASPYTDVTTSFNIPMDKDFVIPVYDKESDETYTEIYRPYIYDFDIDGYELENAITYSNENRSATIFAKKPFNAKRVTAEIEVRAKKKEGERYKEAIIPEGDNKGKIWNEKMETTFKTTGLPETIEPHLVSSGWPRPNQRYFLKDEEDNGYITFFSDIKDDYFKAKDTVSAGFKKFVLDQKYVARFIPIDGSATHESDITYKYMNTPNKHYKIEFAIPKELQNEQYYYLSIIRKTVLTPEYEKAYNAFKQAMAEGPINSSSPTANDITNANVNVNSNINALSAFGTEGSSANLPNVTTRRSTVFTAQEKSLSDINMTVNILSNKVNQIPGRVDKVREFTLLKIPFKTSRYNTLSDKLEGITLKYNPQYNEKTPSGSLQTFAVDVISDEQFDTIDINGKRYENEKNSKESFDNPIVFFAPEVKGTKYWEKGARPMYTSVQAFTDNMAKNSNRYFTKKNTASISFKSDIHAGQIYTTYNFMGVNIPTATYSFLPLKQKRSYNLAGAIYDETNYLSLYRFSNFRKGIAAPISEAELESDWETDVVESNCVDCDFRQTIIQQNMSTLNIALTGRANGGINDSGTVAALSAAVDRSKTLTLMYDLQRPVLEDFYKFKKQQKEYARFNVSGFVHGVAFNGGLLVKEHIQNSGSGYYLTEAFQNKFNNYFYKVNTPSTFGTYKIRLGRYVTELDYSGQGNDYDKRVFGMDYKVKEVNINR